MLEWFNAAGAVAVGAALMFVPGAVVVLAGFGWTPRALLGSPGVSAALLAASAMVAPLVGLRWSLLPVALATAILSGIVFFVRRRWWSGATDLYARIGWWAPVIGGGIGAVLVAYQLVHAFVGPTEISQTFDNVAHLNMVRWALDHGSASAFEIAKVTGAPFYPNGWASFASLVTSVSGTSIPVAVNSANIVIGALVWPASCMALAAAVFRGTRTAVVVSGVLAAAFGAFPILLFDFGVLYPNAFGYALLPGVLAVAIEFLGIAAPAVERSRADVVRLGVLLVGLAGGLGLVHPNAFLALLALSAPLLIPWALQRQKRGERPQGWASPTIVVAVAYGVMAVIWLLARTPYALSRWAPWESQAQALGEGLLVAPRDLPVGWLAAGLLLIGLASSLRAPRGVAILAPWAMAMLLFVLAAGTDTHNYVREAITNPWNNDSYRLAALLPTAAIPVATAGALVVVGAVRHWLHRRSAPAVVTRTVAVVGLVVLALPSHGPDVLGEITRAQAVYRATSTSALLTTDERALLDRMAKETPPDALIAGNPGTGTSLAYAIANRMVVQPHIFSPLTADEQFINLNLVHIETDPRVCQAVDRVGVDFVLDFGRQDVHNRPDLDYDGIENLSPSPHLALVDSQGSEAKLFRIQGC